MKFSELRLFGRSIKFRGVDACIENSAFTNIFYLTKKESYSKVVQFYFSQSLCVHIWLTLISRVCSEISSSIVSRFAETSYLNFIEIKLTGCHMIWELSVGNLGRDYKQFDIFSFFVVCFCLAPSRVFSEYVRVF